jgi:hypothetical protein
MLRASPRLILFLAATLFLDFSASAQDRLLTLDNLYDPEIRFWDSSFPEAHTRSDLIYSEGAPKSLDPNS